MTFKEKMIHLKAREKLLRNRVEYERRQQNKLRNKSRRIRQNSSHSLRIGFFTDRLRELQLVIRFLDGQIPIDEFIKCQNGDILDQVICKTMTR